MTTSSSAQSRLVPLKDFFRNPAKTDLQLSPDGRYLSWLAPWESRLNVWVEELSTHEVKRVTAATKRDVHNYFWTSPTRLAYLQDEGGDENYQLFGVDATGGNPQALTAFEHTQTKVLDELEDQDDEILVELNRRDPQVFDVHLLDTVTGELTLVVENPGNVTRWLADRTGVVRIAVASEGLDTVLMHRRDETESFRSVLTVDLHDKVVPLFFTFDNRELYAASNRGRDKQAIVRLNLETGEEEEVLFEHPEVDSFGLLASRRRRIVTGVVYQRERLEYFFIDEEEEQARMFAELSERLPNYSLSITSMTRDEQTVLVGVTGDKLRGTYYLFDVGTRELRKVAELAPWLRESEMADQAPIAFVARDGLPLTGYLTRPCGAEGRKLPVVVHPHGGPWARDYWGFDPEVQFLANRGYAVLQINYRGSTGLGRKFWEAGFKQWGRAMQDDLTDGVRWLIEQGIADPDRVGIYGASYGGYATLAGLAFTPELYAAGVDYVGPSNLFTLLETLPAYWGPFKQLMYEQVGDPVADETLLRAASPLFSADKIKAPLLVIQGGNDPRVKKAEADQIVAALKKRGLDVPYIVKDNEGHGFTNEENRIEVYTAIEAFLAQHLGGRHREV